MGGLPRRVGASATYLGALLVGLCGCVKPKSGAPRAAMDSDGGSTRDASTVEVESPGRLDAGDTTLEPTERDAPDARAVRDSGDSAPQPQTSTSDGSDDEPTSPSRDAAPPPLVPELFVDYFMQPCRGSELCLRTSNDGRTWRTDTPVEWDGFEWGHRYRLRFHEAGPDGSVAFVVDEVLQDDAVEAGTRFSFAFTPVLNDAGPGSLVAIAGPEHGWLGDGGRFECTPELCAAVDEASSNQRVVELLFEFDAETAMRLIAVTQPGIDDGDLDRLAEAWASEQPSEYVVRVCTTGATPYSCKLASVAAGQVVEGLERGADTPWANASFTHSPIDELFDFALSGFSELSSECSTTYLAAEDYPYIEEVSTRCSQMTSGLQVTCFVPESLEVSDCSE